MQIFLYAILLEASEAHVRGLIFVLLVGAEGDCDGHFMTRLVMPVQRKNQDSSKKACIYENRDFWVTILSAYKQTLILS